jgi:hypothetical protein
MEGVVCQGEKNQKICNDLAVCGITKTDGERGEKRFRNRHLVKEEIDEHE